MRLALVRHPRPLIDVGICYGRLDLPLAGTASRDISDIIAALGRFRPSRIVTSPAVRCKSVADAVAGWVGRTAETDPRLLECDFGDWEGTPWDSLPRADLDRWAAAPLAFAAPNGETGAALIDRVRACFIANARLGLDCAIVTHGGPLKVLGALARGRPVDLLRPAPPFGSVEIVSIA